MPQQHSSATDGNAERPRRARRADPAVRKTVAQAVEAAVVPCLVAMPWIGAAPAEPLAPDAEAVERLVALSLDDDPLAAARFIARLHRRGLSAEAIYAGLLTPTARRLGVMWEEDECTFTDVTIGVLRLQNAQRALSPEFVGRKRARLGAPRVLLMPTPGEQHTFGLTMVLDHFRRAGWEATASVARSEADALDLVRATGADLVGVSLSCDDHLDTVTALVTAIRAAAANRHLAVMLGGARLIVDPGLAARLGADGTAGDAEQAVLRANELLQQAAGQA